MDEVWNDIENSRQECQQNAEFKFRREQAVEANACLFWGGQDRTHANGVLQSLQLISL